MPIKIHHFQIMFLIYLINTRKREIM